jgi:hypothetical protein
MAAFEFAILSPDLKKKMAESLYEIFVKRAIALRIEYINTSDWFSLKRTRLLLLFAISELASKTA